MADSYHPRLYCVECGGLMIDLSCGSCRRTYRTIDGIPCLLSREDEDSELFQRYFRNYSRIARDDIAEDIMPIYYKNAQADKIIGYCGRIGKRTVLDVGAGKGLLLQRMPRSNRVAVDIAVEYLNDLKNEGIVCIAANAERLPFADEFDLVLITDVLEHVLHPERVLQGVRRALRRGGRAVIRVPYKEDLSSYTPEAGCKYEFVHLRSFDEVSLRQAIESSGLGLIRLHYDGFQLSRVREDSPNPIVRLIARRLRMHLQAAKYDSMVCRLPNWLGCVLFRPIEIVAVAEKATQDSSE